MLLIDKLNNAENNDFYVLINRIFRESDFFAKFAWKVREAYVP